MNLRSPRNIVIVASLLCLVLAIVVNVATAQRKRHTVKEKKQEPPKRKKVVSINEILTNEICQTDGVEYLDRTIERFMRRWGIKGGSFALMRGDSLIYAKGYGYANIKDSVRCDVGNTFRIASASKLITATAIMKLKENGRLSLNSQVFGEDGILNDSIFLDIKSKYLKNITIEHLLRHTAGFSTPIGDVAFNNAGVARNLDKSLPLSLDDMVVYASRNRLRYRPGGSYDYSNLGYLVLTKVVEKVTHMEYERYIQDSILYPAGCYDLHVGQNFSKDKAANEVSYYEVKEAKPVDAYDGSGREVMKSDGGNNITLLSGAGGWVASSVELLRFVAAINNDSGKKDILSSKSIRTMTYGSKKTKPIGWASIHSSYWLRSGSMSGTCTLIKRQDNGYTWVFLANSSVWIGPNISRYTSYTITRALSRIKEWPKRDLFNIDSFTENK